MKRVIRFCLFLLYGHSYFWAVVDGGAGDYIELIDVDADGKGNVSKFREKLVRIRHIIEEVTMLTEIV